MVTDSAYADSGLEALHSPRSGGWLAGAGLVVELGSRRVLDDVSIDVEPGLLTALTGPSGAGKSTLLWVLAGAAPASGGSVTLDGAAVGDRTVAARAGVVLVPQGNALVAALTAQENVLVPLAASGLSAAESRARGESALAAVGLSEARTHLVEELSGGQQQRVAVARALAAAPRVLLADEPTSDLDGTTRETIVALLAGQARAGAAVLMATHDPWCAEQADVEFHLDEGRITRVR